MLWSAWCYTFSRNHSLEGATSYQAQEFIFFKYEREILYRGVLGYASYSVTIRFFEFPD